MGSVEVKVQEYAYLFVDSSTLIALAKISELDILKDIFGKIAITTVAREEVLIGDFPETEVLNTAMDEWIAVIQKQRLQHRCNTKNHDECNRNQYHAREGIFSYRTDSFLDLLFASCFHQTFLKRLY